MSFAADDAAAVEYLRIQIIAVSAPLTVTLLTQDPGAPEVGVAQFVARRERSLPVRNAVRQESVFAWGR